jgi:hypothetical protein
MAAIESPLKRTTPERLLICAACSTISCVRDRLATRRRRHPDRAAPRSSCAPLGSSPSANSTTARRLDLDELTHWLCEISHRRITIDPLKVNVNKPPVMSYAFARHNILAVEVLERNRHRQRPAVHGGVEGMLARRCADGASSGSSRIRRT